MSKKKYRYSVNYSVNKFKTNNEALYKKLVAFYYRTASFLETKELHIILYMLSVLARKQKNVSVPENENMNSIIDCIAAKYNVMFSKSETLTEWRREDLVSKYQSHIDETYKILEPSITDVFIKLINAGKMKGQIYR